MEEYPSDLLIYPEFRFQIIDEIIFMTRDLPENEVKEEESNSQLALPARIETILVKDTSEDDLCSCFYESFKTSGDRNVFSLSEEEKKEYFHSYYNRTDEMIDDASIVLVKGTKIIGFTFVRPTHGEHNGHLYGIGVLPEFRGIQLGSHLLNYVITTLKKLGYKTVSLAVDIANEAAVKLYEKHEFVKDWRRITHAWKKEMEVK